MNTVIYLQFFIIRAVLGYLEPEIPYSLAAERLLLGTAAQESHLGELVGHRCDLRMYQMESKTEVDIWDNFLPRHPKLFKKIKVLMDAPAYLGSTHYYAAAMVRVHYWRLTRLSKEITVDEMARVWKKYYNTKLGKGTVGDFKVSYYRLIEGREAVR